jgi:type 1 fimbriae regulatory protein FimB
LSAADQEKYYAISSAQKNAFFTTLEQIRVFTGITLYQNTIDYLLGAFSLFPQLQNIPRDYWLSPINWEPQTLPKRLQLLKSKRTNQSSRRF